MMFPLPAVARPVKNRSVTVALLLSCLLASGCARSSGRSGGGQSRSPGAGAVAMVGSSPISTLSLERALAHSLADPRVVLDRLINVRALGIFAEHGGLDLGRLQMVKRSIQARVLLEHVEAQTRMPELPSDAELESMTRRRWIELDRPEAVQTCHAVVRKAGLEPAAGLAIAQRLADALRPLTQCKEFVAQAKTFPTAGVKVTAEELPPVTMDGRTLILDNNKAPVDEGDAFDPEFARAAHQLKSPGTQSPIVRTQFGWHIIMLDSRIEAKHVALDERQRLLKDDVFRERAKAETDRRLTGLRQQFPVNVERASIEAIGRVQVAP